MNTRTRSLSVVITLLTVASVALATVTATTVGASGSHTHSGKAKSSASRCAKKVAAKGTVTYSDWQFPDTLNPAQTSLLVTTRVIDGMFDSLFYYNQNAKLTPQLATTTPTVKNGGVTNGGKTIVIHIKKGTYWSDGTETTSQDIKFSWGIGMNADSGPACLGTCDTISRIDTPDKYTAVFHFKQVYAPALANAVDGFTLYPHKWAGAWNNDVKTATDKIYQDPKFSWEGPDYPTNGPYQVAPNGFVNNDRITLRPMKYYSDMSCGAYIKNLIFSFYSAKPGLIAAAATGQTDETYNYTAADLPELTKHHNYKLFVSPSFTFEHLEFNTDKTYKGQPNPTGDAKVRQALGLALDKIGLIRGALGLSEKSARSVVAWTPWVNTPQLVQPFADKSLTGQYDPLTKKYDPNPGKGRALADAKKLLSQTPFKGGFSLDFYTTSGNAVRQAQEAVIAASWEHIGVKLNPNYIPTSKLFASFDHGGIFQNGQFQVGMFGFTGSPEPDGLKQDLVSTYIDREKAAGTHSDINGNYSAIHDKIIDNGFKAGAGSYNNKVRAKAYAQVQVEINKMNYWDGLFFRPGIGTWDQKFTGFHMHPTGAPELSDFGWKPLHG